MNSHNTQKKKLLYIITKGNWGGAQRYVYDLATSMTDEFDVSVAIGVPGTLNTKLREHGITVRDISSLERDVSVFRDIRAFVTLFRLLREVRPDVVHLNSSKIGVMGALTARLAGVKRILFTAHGWAFREDRNLPSRVVIAFLQWLTVLLCHQTIAVSEDTAEHMIHAPFAGDKITTIHNGIDAPQLRDRDEAREALIGKDLGNKLWFGTIAELHKNKGLIYAIKGFASTHLPHAIFVIIGEGEERTTLEKEIAAHNCADRVFLVGHKDEAAKLLSAFDAFILPSIKEGLPYVVLEAAFAKLPVIASNTGGIPEIISDNTLGILTTPKHSNEIKQAFERMTKSEEVRTDMGEALFEKVSREFTLTHVRTQTRELYL